MEFALFGAGSISCTIWSETTSKPSRIGTAGIVVSHQGGTVLDYAVPPAKILPRIAKTINRRVPIFLDGGISSGLDAFKALALGVDGVCVGKAVMAGLAADGAERVRWDDFTPKGTRAVRCAE